ncbi:hypothetical protein TBK1r_35090 [Stieleria magnilauensis]|uniref:Uncharacterized protein n=1 Tax=Stieleria magnilauensis TaxID=2527963 RepID=A0ABX5XRB1_9BACT|nr:hypothetical protein TBK1r_35090 [Planctomycetes bacterium TBK1r]
MMRGKMMETGDGFWPILSGGCGRSVRKMEGRKKTLGDGRQETG